MKRIVCLALLLIFCSFTLTASESNSFIFTQLRYNGQWDPYPNVWQEIQSFLTATTSVQALPERRVVDLRDPQLFSSPFLYVAGQDEFPAWNHQERENLKQYLLAGGILVIDDTSAGLSFGFERSINRELRVLFPDRKMERVPLQHAVFRSFYLLRQVTGRRISHPYLEALFLNDRIIVLYSSNDLLGVWSRDHLGNWLKECIPGGEPQRLEGMKLMLNIILFSLTGTYKSDKIHEPFIDRKLEK